MNIANKLTLFRVILVPIFVYFILSDIKNGQFIGTSIFIVAALTDFLDGYLARKYNLVTTFGKFIDPLADKILTMSAFILLVEMQVIGSWGVIIIIAREFIVTGFRVIAASNQVTIAASPYGKFKTVLQLVSIIWLLLSPVLPLNIGLVIYYFALFMTILSGIDYLYKNIEIMDLNNL